jgi:hypothetical protein
VLAFVLEGVLVIFEGRAFLDLFDQVDEILVVVVGFGAGFSHPF